MHTQRMRGRLSWLLALASIHCSGAAFTSDDTKADGAGGDGSAGAAPDALAGSGADEPDEPDRGGAAGVEPTDAAGQAGSAPDEPGASGAGGSGGEDPPVVTLDLVECGANAFGTGIMPTLYSTLDDALAVTEPEIGELGFVGNAEGDYHGDHCGTGINIDETGDYVKYHYQDNQVRHFDPLLGSMDFWYLPSFSHTDGLNHHLFGTANWGTVGGMRVRKAGADNLNAFQVIWRGAALDQLFQVAVPASEYTLSAGQWSRITLIWYLAPELPERYVRLFIDGQLAAEDSPPSTFQMAPDANGFFVLGVWDFGDAEHAAGILDDFKVFPRGP